MLHAIVLTFPDEVARVLSELRELVKHQQYVSYRIEPHLTLKQPFMPDVDITVINERLRAVAERTMPFTLVINGIEYFEETNNVAYAAVENKQPVIELHTNIVHTLNGLVKQEDTETYEVERFTPHVTIAESIPEDVFPSISEALSDYELHLECEISAFALYSGTWDGAWEPVSVFKLSGC